MNNWVKMTNDEMEVGIEIATLKKGELQIKYAKDIVAKNKEIERLNTNLEVAKEDLTRIAQLLDLEEGCTIYDIEDKIERLNNIINSIDTRLIEMGVDEEMLNVCEMYDVNGIELRKMIKELKGVDKE